MYKILNDFNVHFLSCEHNCASEGQQNDLHFLFSGQHTSIKVIYIEDDLLSTINAVHRVFMKGRVVTTVRPVCGVNALLDDELICHFVFMF